MVYLPETMPASFQAIYTPVESAGTEAQIKHLARLMATQMTAAGLGPGERPGAGLSVLIAECSLMGVQRKVTAPRRAQGQGPTGGCVLCFQALGWKCDRPGFEVQIEPGCCFIHLIAE